jgi:hypothetical protein
MKKILAMAAVLADSAEAFFDVQIDNLAKHGCSKSTRPP